MASVSATTTQTGGVAPPKTMPEGLVQAETNLTPTPEKGLKIDEIPNPPRVTPLHQLGEKPAWIDCPFCKRRSQTKVDKAGSSAQTLMSVVCCLVCICLVCLPQAAGWFENYDHYCLNCNQRVARKLHDDGQTQVFAPQSVTDVPSTYQNAVPTNTNSTPSKTS